MYTKRSTLQRTLTYRKLNLKKAEARCNWKDMPMTSKRIKEKRRTRGEKCERIGWRIHIRITRMPQKTHLLVPSCLTDHTDASSSRQTFAARSFESNAPSTLPRMRRALLLKALVANTVIVTVDTTRCFRLFHIRPVSRLLQFHLSNRMYMYTYSPSRKRYLGDLN